MQNTKCECAATAEPWISDDDDDNNDEVSIVRRDLQPPLHSPRAIDSR